MHVDIRNIASVVVHFSMFPSSNNIILNQMASQEEDEGADLVKSLQKANEDRWEHLQDLHQQYLQLSSSQASSVPIAAFLQAERDVVSVHGTAHHKCDELLDEMEGKSLDADRFGAELVERCDQLYELDLLFQEKIQFQKEFMEKIEYSIQEQRMTQRKLKQFQGELDHEADQRENTMVDQQENERLRGDLAYLASLVAPTVITSDGQGSCNMNELLVRLLDRYMASPGDPFLSCREGNVDKKHVEILKNSWMIESFDHDDDMIRLTDYLQED
jgi:hypothetical protein